MQILFDLLFNKQSLFLIFQTAHDLDVVSVFRVRADFKADPCPILGP